MKRKELGFTLIELMLVIGICSILFGFATINLVRQQNSVSVQTLADTLVSDIYSQQNSAMVGSGNGASYGIFFETNRYTLFQGDDYSQNDPNNFVVNMDPGYSIVNVSFTNGIVIFSSGNGELSEYALNKDSATIQNDSTGISKKIKLNRYGVVIEED